MDSHRIYFTHPFDYIASGADRAINPNDRIRKYESIIQRWKSLLCTRICLNIFNLIWCIGLYFLIFTVLLSAVFSIFHFALDDIEKVIVLDALALFGDWKQFPLFFSIYIGFAMKKDYDTSNVSWCD